MLNNLREIANHYHITGADYELAGGIIGSRYRMADLVIAPDGSPYLYRWHIVPPSMAASVYFHIQVADDPERPLHDHPWDNMSVILSGGYDELLATQPDLRCSLVSVVRRRVGDTVTRKAAWAHRLLLPDGVPYTMTLFSTGPKIRRWGFWYPEGWVDADEVCRMDGNVSKHIRKEGV